MKKFRTHPDPAPNLSKKQFGAGQGAHNAHRGKNEAYFAQIEPFAII